MSIYKVINKENQKISQFTLTTLAGFTFGLRPIRMVSTILFLSFFLFSLAIIQGNAPAEASSIVVDASKDPTTSGYTNTGIFLTSNQSVLIQAMGRAYYAGTTSYSTDPDGNRYTSSGTTVAPKYCEFAH
ncbi:hypothetical protein [Ferviditalea candida]|uniref:Uncharacterized protein n=1 Tax=Ferviditalea candida TaxID=3108399 RepID=A0ABU5ZN06_9BACL|nr:hypothetical protein [Paenibacillaceae bacterium T2]